MTSSTDSPESDGQLIEGGEIQEIDENAVKVDPLKHHQAKTSRTIAYSLIIVLAASVLCHYLAVVAILLYTQNQTLIDALGDIFSAWLPVISGLTGSAVTYYFTREQ